MEVEGAEGRKRDFQEALMQDITDEEEQLFHQSINQQLKLPRGISSQDQVHLHTYPPGQTLYMCCNLHARQTNNVLQFLSQHR